MIIKRKLTEEERNYLIEVCRKDMGRKLVRGFMWAWKAVFFLGLYGLTRELIAAIAERDVFRLFSVLALPFLYLMFWKLPDLVLRSIDARYEALRKGQVLLRETDLVSIRLHRERIGSGSNRYHTVYYASIWYIYRTHTYEILADPLIASLPPGSNICVLQFPESRSLVNTEYALPFDFLQRDIGIPIS